MWRNYQVAGDPLFFLQRFDDVIEERYQPQSNLYQTNVEANAFSRIRRNYATVPNTRNANILDRYQFIPKHFVHNLVTSILILPPSPVLDDLRHVVDGYPYWDRMSEPWRGQLELMLSSLAPVPGTEAAPLDEETRQQLRELGYLRD